MRPFLKKMEVKRLTADRYPLHFEVCTRDPIGVGKRNGQQHQARYSKAFGWCRRLLSFWKKLIVHAVLLYPVLAVISVCPRFCEACFEG
jgi:hypothetical protein